MPDNYILKTKSHEDDTDLGQLTRTIYIETDNKDSSKLQVSFNVNVIKK